MFGRWAISALSLILTSQIVAGPVFAASSTPSRFHLSTELVPAANEKVGPKRAGLACLPLGATHVHDFISTPDDILFPLRQEFERRGFLVDITDPVPVSSLQLIVRLERITASLCANSWLGDRSRLKGKATFKFSWRHGKSDPPLDRTYIVIDSRDRDSKLRLSEFLPFALVQLSARISPPPG